MPARVHMLLGKILENTKYREGHTYWMPYSDITNLLESNGFRIGGIRMNGFFNVIFRLRNITQCLTNFLPSVFVLSFVTKVDFKYV